MGRDTDEGAKMASDGVSLHSSRAMARKQFNDEDFGDEGPPKIQHHLEAYGLELQRLRETIGMLSDRITPVLGPERDEKYSDPSEEGPVAYSEITRVVLDYNNMLRRMNLGLQELIRRIEL